MSATFKWERYFIADNRDIPRSRKRGFLLKIFAEYLATGMYEIVVRRVDPLTLRRFKQIGRAVIEIPASFPVGADRTSRWHSQTKLRVTKIFAYYSAALSTRKRISPHISERLFIFRARKRSAPRHFCPNIYHLQLQRRQRSSEETWTGS